VTTAPGHAPSRYLLIPLIATLLLVVYLAFLVFRPFILTFAVAGSVAILLRPVHRRLAGWLRGREALAAGILVIAVTLLILLPITAAAGLLGSQAVTFFEWVRPNLQPQSVQDFLRETVTVRYPWLGEWLSMYETSVSELVSAALSRGAAAANILIQRIVGGLTTAAFELLIFVLMLFFLLRDGAHLRQRLQEISPFSSPQEEAALEHLGRTVKGVLLAMIVVPLAQAAVAFVGFAALGVPGALLWSLVVLLAAFIPILGATAGWVPAVIYLFFYGHGWQWLGMLAYGVLAISTIDNIIKPLVLREAARIHPLLGFLSILGGVMAFGPMGFLIGPVILSLVLSAVRIYRSDVLRSWRERAEVAAGGAPTGPGDRPPGA
jgi:predicted PurR-regulated permease PerM